MSRYHVTFAYADRLPGSRRYEVAVDLRRDFNHVALLVATIPEDQISGHRGREPVGRARSVARYAAAIAGWAAEKIEAGQLIAPSPGDRRVDVPGAELVLGTIDDEHVTLTDGDEVLSFES